VRRCSNTHWHPDKPVQRGAVKEWREIIAHTNTQQGGVWLTRLSLWLARRTYVPFTAKRFPRRDVFKRQA